MSAHEVVTTDPAKSTEAARMISGAVALIVDMFAPVDVAMALSANLAAVARDIGMPEEDAHKMLSVCFEAFAEAPGSRGDA